MKKYFYNFETDSDYESFKNTTNESSICYVKENDTIIANKKDYSKEYLTFIALENGEFKFTGSGIYYSLDNGNTWVSLSANQLSPTVEKGEKIMWKGNMVFEMYAGVGTFSSTGLFIAEGNVMSLTYGDNFIGKDSMDNVDFAFMSLFRNCATIKYAKNMILPLKRIGFFGYAAMFYNCTQLTAAPTIPDITLSDYYNSFAFSGMFYGCSNLTYVRFLITTSFDNNIFIGDDVSSNGVFVINKQTMFGNDSFWYYGKGVPSGWIVKYDK